MTLHVSVPELAWTIPAVGAAIFRGIGVVTAIQDYLVVRDAEGDGVLLLAQMRIREEALGCVVNCLFATVGFYAFTQPDPPHPPTGELVLTGVLISAITLLFLNALLRTRERKVLRAHLRSAGEDL